MSAGIGLRQSEEFKATALGILDRYGRSAWPHCRSVVRPPVLLTMKSLTNRLFLLSVLAALPFTLFAGTSETVTLDVENMTCSICPITVKKALEKVAGVTMAKRGF